MILKRCTNCADDGGRGYDNRVEPVVIRASIDHRTAREASLIEADRPLRYISD